MSIVIGFCAAQSGTGKTTLILRVLKELQQLNVKTAVIKHGTHWHIDESKDSCRYAASGAEASLFVSPFGWVMESHPVKELPLRKAIAFIDSCTECEVLLIEGYKNAPIEKIAVCRKAVSLELPCPKDQLLAVVSDVRIADDLKHFSYSQEDVKRICSLILSRPTLSRIQDDATSWN